MLKVLAAALHVTRNIKRNIARNITPHNITFLFSRFVFALSDT